MFLDFHSEIYSWIRGGLLILSLYHFLIYFKNKRKAYLYYSLFLFGLFVYFLRDIIDPALSKRVFSYANFPLLFLIYAVFSMFARELLETKKTLPFWDKVLSFEINILLVISVLFIALQHFFGYNAQIKTYLIISPLLSIFTLVLMLFLYKIPGNIPKYFVAGTVVYVLLANISFFGIFINKELFIRNGVEPVFFVYLGAIIQSIIYASSIAQRVREIELDNKSIELRLAFKYKELEELKMTALQSQMNPHFLFNSLNSINNFILKSDVEKASDYITKFSKLIRVILKSSSSLTVPFSEELDILSLYVKLEQMRINGGFKYTVVVDEAINLEEIKVPPLFLQPYIENSIWHGLTHIDGEKRISLTVNKKGGAIICEIIDNGRGIDKAKKEAHKKIDRRKFFGTQATESRIRLLYKRENVKISITDISNDTSTGTKVQIIFPYIKKKKIHSF